MVQRLPAFMEGITKQTFATPTTFGLSPTEKKIKEIATQKSSPKEPQKLTRQDLFDDAKKIVEAKQLDKQTALTETLKYYQAKGLQVDGVDIDQELQGLSPQPEPVESVKEDGNLVQDIGGALKVDSKFDIDLSENDTLLGSVKNNLKQLANAGRFAVNLPGDTIEFIGDLGQLVMNPIDTVKGIAQVGDAVAAKIGITEDGAEKEAIRAAIGQSINDNFGSFEKAINTMETNPFDTLTTIFGGAGLAKAGLTKAGAPASVINKLDELSQLSNPLTVAKAEFNLGKGIVKPIVNAPLDIGKSLTARASGLNPETLTQLFKNPDLVKKGILSKEGTATKVVNAIDKRIDEVGDLGKEYKSIREYTGPIAVEKIAPEGILEKFNIRLGENGKLDFSNSSIGTTGNKNAIESAYNLIKTRDIKSGDNILSLRQALDDTINYKTEATGAAEKIVRAMRGNVDDVAKESIPKLRELDSKFGTEIQELNKVKGLIYDKQGNLKDTYIADVARLVTDRNSIKLDRIEKLVPEIGDEIRALKALEDVEFAKGNKVGTYVQSGILGGGLGTAAITANPLLALSTVLITSPTVVSNIVRAAGYSAKATSSIANKIKNGIKLTASEANIVSKSIQEQMINKAGDLADNLADKTGARAKFMDDGGIDAKVFHTSSKEIGDLTNDKIFWTTEDIKYAQNFGKSGSRKTYEISSEGLKKLDSYSDKGKKILDDINKSLPKNKQFSDIYNRDGGVSAFFIQDDSVVKKLRELRYDAVEVSELYKGGTKSIGIINPTKIKSKKLIDDGE